LRTSRSLQTALLGYAYECSGILALTALANAHASIEDRLARLTPKQGVFRTQPVEARHRPPGIGTIDALFESVASEREQVTIAETGTGTNGAAGAMRIEQAGGMVLVQDPATAMYDGMPPAVMAADAASAHLPR